MGPNASGVYGDFHNGEHVTYITFPAGMITPVHTHSANYVGIVIRGTTMHWQPGKPDTQVELAEGSHWRIAGGVPHVSECLEGSDCVMAIIQQAAFDFLPAYGLPLDDAAIVAIYQQVNGFDIAMGELATIKGHNESVKLLGAKVRDEHSDVLKATTQLAKKLGIRPVLPVERGAAETEHQQKLSELNNQSAEDFDRAYLLHEIKFHSDAIRAVETTLLPNTNNTELRKLLVDILPAFRGHLVHTENLAKQLGYN